MAGRRRWLLLALGAVTCISGLVAWSVPSEAQPTPTGGWAQQLNTPATQPFQGLGAISCVNGLDCWAVGGNPAFIWVTRDGGSSWTAQQAPPSLSADDALASISCTDSLHCWAVSGKGVIINTVNGGATWVAQFGPSTFAGPISCTDNEHCFVLGPTGVLSTSDGGHSWQQVWAPPAPGDFNQISCVRVNCWVAGDSALVYATTNGGGSWTKQTLPGESGAVSSISCSSSAHCVTVGHQDFVTFDGGEHWFATAVPKIQDPNSGISNGDLLAVSCLAGTMDCWAPATVTSYSANVLATSDGGMTWRIQGQVSAGGTEGMIATFITCPTSHDCWIGAFASNRPAIAASHSLSVPPIGYYLLAKDGGVFAFGPGAKFYGSTGNVQLAKPIVGMAVDPATGGYWMVGADGGVFSFNAPFYGSTGAIHLTQPVVGIANTP